MQERDLGAEGLRVTRSCRYRVPGGASISKTTWVQRRFSWARTYSLRSIGPCRAEQRRASATPNSGWDSPTRSGGAEPGAGHPDLARIE